MKTVLETDRLYLREFVLDDSKYIYKLHNDHDVMKYISSNKESGFTEKQCEDFVKKCIGRYNENSDYGIWATIIKDTGEFIGWTTLKDLDGTEDIEIGYRYLKQYWGKGYATEASKALVDYGFNVLNLNRITAVAMAENKASTRVMEKIGMTYEGIKNYYNVDVAYYEIIKTI